MIFTPHSDAALSQGASPTAKREYQRNSKSKSLHPSKGKDYKTEQDFYIEQEKEF
jgi:hypothetical protein